MKKTLNLTLVACLTLATIGTVNTEPAKEKSEKVVKPTSKGWSVKAKVLAALGVVATGIGTWILYNYLNKPALQQKPQPIPQPQPAPEPEPNPGEPVNLDPVGTIRYMEPLPQDIYEQNAPQRIDSNGCVLERQPVPTSANQPAARNPNKTPISLGRNFGRGFANPALLTPGVARAMENEETVISPEWLKNAREGSDAALPARQLLQRVQQPAPAPAQRTNATNRQPERITMTQRVFDTLMAEQERNRVQEEAARAASRAERERILEQELRAEEQERMHEQARIEALTAENERNNAQIQAQIEESINATQAENKQFVAAAMARLQGAEPLDHNDVATLHAESERIRSRNQARLDELTNRINQNNSHNAQDEPE